MFHFLRNHQIFFQSVCTLLHSYQQWIRVSLVPHCCHYLVVSVFWIFTVLIDMQSYFVAVLIFISLLTYDVDHLQCLFPIIFFDEVSVKVFGPVFKSGCLYSYYWVLRILCMFRKTVFLHQMSFANIFPLPVACLLMLLTVQSREF